MTTLYDKNPDLFPTGEPKSFVPTPLETLGDDIFNYSWELSGSDLSLVTQTGQTSTVTLPSSGPPPVVSHDLVSYTIGEVYDVMEDLEINEILLKLDNGDWWTGSAYETEMSAYLPDPANLSVGDEIYITDWEDVIIPNGRRVIFLEGQGGAYTFDNPNIGDNYVWDGEQSRVRVTGASTYEILA